MSDIEPGAATRRERPRLYGMLVALGLLALVAVPAAYSALAALFSFSGCFLTCGDQQPMSGLLLSGVTLALLALPIVAGVTTARAASPRSRSLKWAVVILTVSVLTAPTWLHWVM